MNTRLETATIIFLLAAALAGPAAAQEAQEAELVVSFVSGRVSFNPLNAFSSSEAQLYTALYEGLVTYNPLSLDPVPAAAKSWEVSADGLIYTFSLREDARYWNGDPVTADDFKATWLTFLAPASKAEYSFLYDVIEGAYDYRTGRNADPGSVKIEALDRKTLKVTLAQPASHFLKILCHHSFVPIHPRLRDRRDWNDLPSMLGNGPYFILKHSPKEITLRRNELYWDAKRVKVPNLRIVFLDDPDEIAKRFNSGQIHWATSGMDMDKVENRAAIIVNPMFATNYYYITARSAPWSNPDVRKALALLVPWNEVRNTRYQFIPATTLVPPIPFYPQPRTIAAADKDEALRLLAAAGFALGRGLPKITIKIPDGGESKRLAALFAAAWKEHIGAEVEIQTVNADEYYEKIKKDDFTIGTLTWIGDFADPLTFLQMWSSTSNLNDAGFSDAEYDRLIKLSFGQAGPQRYKTLSDAESILLQSAVVLPINHSPAINLIDLEAVSGWFLNPLDIHPFKYLGFAEDRVPRGVVEAKPERAAPAEAASLTKR